MTKAIYLATLTILLGFYSCTKPTKACFNIVSGELKKDSTIYFDASCSEMTHLFQWSFENGKPDTVTHEPIMKYRFTESGSYIVRLHSIRKDGIGSLKSKPDTEKQVIIQ